MDFVLSLDKALRLVALLQGATEVDRDYRSGRHSYIYHACAQQPNVSMDVLQAGQFINSAKPGSDLGDDE